ncbi:MAG: transcriptional regulator, TrmB domain protein [Glaciihabitans sp.]|nr:transcriptional regulator, TrmB domain protein [Glaciihabitans sp.]
MLEQLLELGLDQREAQFYITVLSLGRTTVAKAALQANVSRTSGYDLARRLVGRGFLQTVEFGDAGRKQDRIRSELAAADPSSLFADLEKRRALLEDLVPQLRAIQSASAARPKVRYLEGVTGIREALFETLTWPSPIRGIFSMKDLFVVPGEQALEEYIEGRRARGLTLRVVRSTERDIPQGWPTSAGDFRVARHTPSSYVFTMTTVIGEDAVAVISSRREGFAMIISSSEYAQTQASLFEVLWNASDPA